MMRYGSGLIAAALALAWVGASPSSAQQEATAPPPPASTGTNLQILEQRTTTALSTPADGSAIGTAGGATDGSGARRPTRLVEASPLTADECTTLGGEVVTDFTGVCVSGAFCRTTDNSGKKHRVCLSRKQ